MLLAGAALAWWFYDRDTSTAKSSGVSLDEGPQLSIDNGEITGHRPSGELKFKLSFTLARDFTNRGVVLIDRPSVRYFPFGAEAWNLTADSAILQYGSPHVPDVESRIEFHEEVRIDARNRHGEPFKLRSRFIEVHLEDERIRSPGPVSLESPHFTATAASMDFGLEEGSMRLFGNSTQQVHVKFSPNPSP